MSGKDYARERFKWLRQIARDTALSHAAVRVGVILASHINEGAGFAFPSQAAIVSTSGLTRRGVQKCINALVDHGHLHVESGQGWHVVNHYSTILKPPDKANPRSPDSPKQEANPRSPLRRKKGEPRVQTEANPRSERGEPRVQTEANPGSERGEPRVQTEANPGSHGTNREPITEPEDARAREESGRFAMEDDDAMNTETPTLRVVPPVHDSSRDEETKPREEIPAPLDTKRLAEAYSASAAAQAVEVLTAMDIPLTPTVAEAMADAIHRLTYGRDKVPKVRRDAALDRMVRERMRPPLTRPACFRWLAELARAEAVTA